MNDLSQTDTVFVVGTSTFTILKGEDAPGRYMSVTITRDDHVQWTHRHAAWRPLAVGYGGGTAYIWSARDLVVLPADHDDDPSVLTVDEDLLFVFKAENAWLLVCETSVRLIIGREERSRVELGDVVEQARWREGHLQVEDARGITASIRVVEGRLTF
jgi:hypothetical protein